MSTKEEENDNLAPVKTLWLILNGILVLYSFFLFCYGKYFKHKDSLSYVINYIYNIFF